ncbi:hypothetical protein ACU4GD_29875 [Cupriavidus basilensis]
MLVRGMWVAIRDPLLHSTAFEYRNWWLQAERIEEQANVLPSVSS